MSRAKLINVQGTIVNDDPFYRYKMEEVVIVREGVKFAIMNLEQIAISLNRKLNEIVSFLQKHFGAQFNSVKGTTKVLTSKSDLTKSSLQDAIFLFIESNVLCGTCRNPETKQITEKKKTFLECEACSGKTPI